MIRFRDRLRYSRAGREKYTLEKRRLAQRKWRHVQHNADAKTPIVAEIMERANRKASDGCDPAFSLTAFYLKEILF